MSCSKTERPVRICYNSAAAALVDKDEYDKKRSDALNGKCKDSLIIPKKSAKAWVVRANELCRISVIEGSQVAYFYFQSV